MQKLFDVLANWVMGLKNGLARLAELYHPRTLRQRGALWVAGLLVVTLVVVNFVVLLYWDQEPAAFDVRDNAAQMAAADNGKVVVGMTTTAALVRIAETLLDKPGGYLSNDIMPPGVMMDNIPNWEFGVVVQVRDMARAMRNDMSRSQSQSAEDPDLAVAEPQFNFNSESWMFPATESEYRDGIDALRSYMRRLVDDNPNDGQFYARADNLVAWLAIVEKRLGSMSQRLSASVGQARINTDLGGDTAARRTKPAPEESVVKTPWLEVDDVFYEARGMTWALLELLRAVEVDFRDVLQKKNAVVSLRQIVRELDSTQQTVWSPVVLNGRGFGFTANYSLVMASYISRANAGVIDLKNLLQEG